MIKKNHRNSNVTGSDIHVASLMSDSFTRSFSRWNKDCRLNNGCFILNHDYILIYLDVSTPDTLEQTKQSHLNSALRSLDNFNMIRSIYEKVN